MSPHAWPYLACRLQGFGKPLSHIFLYILTGLTSLHVALSGRVSLRPTLPSWHLLLSITSTVLGIPNFVPFLTYLAELARLKVFALNA